MKKIIKNFIKRNKKIRYIVEIIYFIVKMKLKINPLNKKYPKVIQLPITQKCNSKCIMCNIWKMNKLKNGNIDEFEKFINDNIFKEVEFIGINGGEPSLVENLEEYIDLMIKNLKNLKGINLISHGFNTDILLEKLKKIYSICKKNNIHFSIIISLDGVGEIHNKVRGKKVFNKTLHSILTIKNNKSKYCDEISLRCTLSRYNIEYWKEVDAFAKMLGLNIEYGLAVGIKRIDNLSIYNDFSIFNSDKYIQIAKELFFSKYVATKNIYNKFKYYSLLYYLQYRKRILGCSWQNRDITLDSEGNIYYCAVESKKLGNLLEQNGENLFFSKENLEYRKWIYENKCSTCIHDYVGDITLKNGLLFIRELLFDRFWILQYKLRLFYLRIMQ